MKIETVSSRAIHAAPHTNWVFLEIRTHDGRTGTGEANLSGSEERVVAAIEALEPELIGRSVRDVGLADVDVPKGGATSDGRMLRATVRSAIDTALWDLKAQAADMPLASLLGGDAEAMVPLYANINRAASDRSPEGMAAIAQRAVEAGFTAVKCAPFDGLTRESAGGPDGERAANAGLERMQAIRDVIGPDARLMVDCHWRLSPERARALLPHLEALDVAWIEDPFPEEALAEWQDLRHRTEIPLAGGERATSLEELALALACGQYDVCSPDVRHIGGVAGLWHAAHLVHAMGASFAPHNPRGPVGTLASGHVTAAAPSVLALEFPFGECDWRSDLVSGNESIEQAELSLPRAPGIGALLDERVSRRHPFERVVPPRVASEVDIW